MSLAHSKNAKSLISSPYLKGRKQSGIDGFLTLNQMVENVPIYVVAKGFSQIEGIDYEELFSPVIMNLILALDQV